MRNYFSRREQWRLLLLVFAFGAVVMVMRELRRPATSARLSRAFAGGEAVAAEGQDPIPMPVTVQQTPVNSPSTPLTSEDLATIRDNTYFRSDEKEAWFKLISILQQTSDAELAGRSVGEVGYAQLVEQPDAYRGRVVTVRGTVRQVTAEKPAENDLGLQSYYRLVIQPRGGEVWPFFVYVLELPAGFPSGDDVSVDVTATGYFFKNQSYAWQDGLGLAPVILTRTVTLGEGAATPGVVGQVAEAAPQPTPGARERTTPGTPDEATAPPPPADLKEILSLAGWNDDRLGKFPDDQLLSPEQRSEAIQLLWRVRTFDTASIAAWTHRDASLAAVAASPAEYRWQFLRFSGRVRRIESHALPEADAERLEIPRYFECELVLDQNAGIVTVFAARVPQAWRTAKQLDEPASVTGLFVQRLPKDAGRPHILLVAQQVAAATFGRSVLATLGMDVGLLDGVRNHRPIRGSEREAFYRLLAAVDQVGVRQLIRFARQNVGLVAQSWEAELASADPQRRLLAEEVKRRAAEGRYSVAPLFNDADRQIGQLVVVDGIARRIVRVEAAPTSAENVSDAGLPHGIDHYYEMDVFTDDSQNRPLVFCVRELPPGMPTGGDLHEPVRVAGFFFKSWRYRTRDIGTGDGEEAVDPLGKPLIAPLIIGRGAVRIEMDAQRGHLAEFVGGGLFVLALLAIWAAAWWFARGDRQFRARTAAANFSLPAGQSLDELNVPEVGEPMNITGPAVADTRHSL